MEWKHPIWPVKKEFDTQPYAGKVVLTFLGCTKANFGTLPREGHKSTQCPL
jgi:hypothetical protein